MLQKCNLPTFLQEDSEDGEDDDDDDEEKTSILKGAMPAPN